VGSGRGRGGLEERLEALLNLDLNLPGVGGCSACAGCAGEGIVARQRSVCSSVLCDVK